MYNVVFSGKGKSMILIKITFQMSLHPMRTSGATIADNPNMNLFVFAERNKPCRGLFS